VFVKLNVLIGRVEKNSTIKKSNIVNIKNDLFANLTKITLSLNFTISNILSSKTMFVPITKESAYRKIAELVERFSEQYASHKNSEYNEILTQCDFVAFIFSDILLGRYSTG
jgi:hypothetical protein